MKNLLLNKIKSIDIKIISLANYMKNLLCTMFFLLFLAIAKSFKPPPLRRHSFFEKNLNQTIDVDQKTKFSNPSL